MGIVDEFIRDYAGKGREIGWLSERAEITKEELDKAQDRLVELARKQALEEFKKTEGEKPKPRERSNFYTQESIENVEKAATQYSREIIESHAQYDFSVTQDDINDYVDGAYAKTNSEKYKPYLNVSNRLADDVRDEIPDIEEHAHALTDNDIRHTRNSHGEHSNEKYPITADDQKTIPDIVQNYDKVIVKYRKGAPGIVYVKVVSENLVYYLESVEDNYEGQKLLINKQMIKTGITDVPDLAGFYDAIQKKQSLSDFLADLQKIHKTYAQSAGQQVTANHSIGDESENVNSDMASREVTNEEPDTKYNIPEGYGIFIRNTAAKYVDKIFSGEKTVETRPDRTLDSYLHKWAPIVDTAKRQVIGEAYIDSVIEYDDAEDFRADADRHLVPENSKYDWDGKGKRYGYVITDTRKYDTPIPVPDDAKRYGRIATQYSREVNAAYNDEQKTVGSPLRTMAYTGKTGGNIARNRKDGGTQALRLYCTR